MQWDPFGYYSKSELVTGEPTGVGFYEEYPLQATAWTYEELELNEDFDYEGNELDYELSKSSEQIKKELDDLHK